MCKKMKIKEKFRKSFLTPQRKTGRIFTISLLCLSSFMFLYQYWLLDYYICEKFDCSSLVITDIWIKKSFMFIIIGICNIGTTLFIFKNKNIPSIYVAAITLGFLTAAIITGYIPVTMVDEAANLT